MKRSIVCLSVCVILRCIAEMANLCFVGLFTVEMLLKLYSLGLHGYAVSQTDRQTDHATRLHL